MSLKELWELFPIMLTEPNPNWTDWANTEIAHLSHLLSFCSPVINHIGSTAIHGIKAKPIIDILVEVPGQSCFQRIISLMEGDGYICMSRSDKRLSFNKGYTPHGYAAQVFHIHIHLSGDNDEIRFRDFLNNDYEAAKRYEKLKLSLLPAFKNNRDGYTEAKSSFIKEILSQCVRG